MTERDGVTGFDPTVAALASRMALVSGYRESLQRLQDTWDQLTLLGQMSGIAADITSTADEFRALSATLLDSLARTVLRTTLHRMRAQAQVAIDVLVRNLFERTADIGFLATDAAVRELLLAADGVGDAAALRARFAAYVAKYSVYDDVIVLDTDGRVRMRLDPSAGEERCAEGLVTEALKPGASFVESFGPTRLLGGRRGLIYASAIRAPGHGKALGVLCLSFRFDDEMRSIFEHLAPVGPCGVVALCDAAGIVLASSDVWHVPIGAPLVPDRAERGRLFFGGRDYLVTAVSASAYQGYAGPGWTACTLVPVDHAFPAGVRSPGPEFPAGTLDSSTLVADELRSIPLHARRIQRGLERSVWNGEVRGRQGTENANGFGAALLQQVTITGARIKTVIERAIDDLQQSTAAGILDEARSCAGFAIDLMSRNLYERANDCRWWALDEVLQRALDEPGPATRDAAAAVLGHINGLYTVYASLLLLDAEGRVVAASNASGAERIGETLTDDWVRPALHAVDPEAHVRSRFAASSLYGDRPTYVYAAGVHCRLGLGAVAIVFDAEPQFEAMLRDALPKGPDGVPLAAASAIFATREGLVVSSTDPHGFPVGGPTAFAMELATMARGDSRQWIFERDGGVYAAGASMSRGYREHDSGSALGGDDVACIVMIRVGASHAGAHETADPATLTLPAFAAENAATRQLASFYCAGQWLALDTAGVVEAIEVANLTALPGRPASVAGVVLHGKAAVPVIDLRFIRGAPPRAAQSAAAPVIFCRGRGQSIIGVRVDDLGPVFGVAPSAIRPLQGYLAVHDRHAEGVLSFGDVADKRMLTLLSVDSLAHEFVVSRAA